MLFYDSNLCYGVPVDAETAPVQPCKTIGEMDAALRRAGVAGGLVRTIATDVSGVATGNELLEKALANTESDLYGMYTLLPSHTREIPSPEKLPAVMKNGKFAALRLAPHIHNYLAKPGVLADYYEMAAEKRIPVVFDTACGITIEEVYDIMERFPMLSAILAFMKIWPSDRFYRPFLAQFPNLRLDLSSMITDQGIEELVHEYGADRLLFGSRFPAMYIGGAMMQLRHADIPETDKGRIAGGNLRDMIQEAVL